MTDGEMKLVRIIYQTGIEVSILTKASMSEIEAEIFDPKHERDPEWVRFLAFDDKDEPMQFATLRIGIQTNYYKLFKKSLVETLPSARPALLQ